VGLPGLRHEAGLDRARWFWYIGRPEEQTMCLAVPAKIISLEEPGQGVVSYLGTEVRADLSLVPGVKLGDWVIIHAGFAISVLDKKEAQETLRLFREMAKTEL